MLKKVIHNCAKKRHNTKIKSALDADTLICTIIAQLLCRPKLSRLRPRPALAQSNILLLHPRFHPRGEIGVRRHSNLSCQIDLSAIIAVTDLTSPTPPILTGIGTLAWHRRSIWRYRPTPLKSFLRNTEVSVRFFVVPQNQTLPLPREDIMSSPTIYKDWSGIWTRILRLTEFLKMNARLFRALRSDIQPSARRVVR